MAVKKKFGSTYSFADLYDTQAALESGSLESTTVPTTTTVTRKEKGILQNMNRSDVVSQTTADEAYNKDTLGTILGQSDAIAANRKKRLEQEKLSSQGIGTMQSILGGSQF